MVYRRFLTNIACAIALSSAFGASAFAADPAPVVSPAPSSLDERLAQGVREMVGRESGRVLQRIGTFSEVESGTIDAATRVHYTTTTEDYRQSLAEQTPRGAEVVRDSYGNVTGLQVEGNDVGDHLRVVRQQFNHVYSNSQLLDIGLAGTVTNLGIEGEGSERVITVLGGAAAVTQTLLTGKGRLSKGGSIGEARVLGGNLTSNWRADVRNIGFDAGVNGSLTANMNYRRGETNVRAEGGTTNIRVDSAPAVEGRVIASHGPISVQGRGIQDEVTVAAVEMNANAGPASLRVSRTVLDGDSATDEVSAGVAGNVGDARFQARGVVRRADAGGGDNMTGGGNVSASLRKNFQESRQLVFTAHSDVRVDQKAHCHVRADAHATVTNIWHDVSASLRVGYGTDTGFTPGFTLAGTLEPRGQGLRSNLAALRSQVENESVDVTRKEQKLEIIAAQPGLENEARLLRMSLSQARRNLSMHLQRLDQAANDVRAVEGRAVEAIDPELRRKVETQILDS